MSKKTENPSVEIVKELFGDYPEDVIIPIKAASDALGWLEEVFITIEKEALDERNCYRVKKLAELGAYLAANMSDYAGSSHETYIDRLQTIGAAAPARRVRGNE